MQRLFDPRILDPPRPCGMIHAAGVGIMGDPRYELDQDAARALAGVIEMGEGIADRLAWETLLPTGWWRVRAARRMLSLLEAEDVEETLRDELALDFAWRDEWDQPIVVDTPPL